MPQSIPSFEFSAGAKRVRQAIYVGRCDSMNFVLDAEHALAYERQTARRGGEQEARRFVPDIGENRMHRYDWEPVSLVPYRVIAGIKALDVDMGNWGT